MPARKNSLTHAPFNTTGSLVHWMPCPPLSCTPDCCPNITWQPNDVFTATLQISHMTRGCSAKYVNWTSPQSDDHREYPMFIVDLLELMQHAETIEFGIVTGRWQVRKRGQNYGLVMAV